MRCRFKYRWLLLKNKKLFYICRIVFFIKITWLLLEKFYIYNIFLASCQSGLMDGSAKPWFAGSNPADALVVINMGM